MARHYKFDLDKPYKKLPKHVRDVILYGSGDEVITFTHVGDRELTYRRKHPFEGVIPNMQRRYQETESLAVREELAKYMSHKPCSECDGSRLRTEARNVFIADKPLHHVTQMPINVALEFFSRLKLKGQRAEIADKIIKDVSNRLGFLVSVGLDYIDLARSAETLSGGEAQRIRLASQIGAGDRKSVV